MQIRRVFEHVLDFCYPGACANCDATTESSAILCGDCNIKLNALVSAPSCDRCALPIHSHGAPCPHCVGGGIPHYERVVRLGVFEDPLKHLIHQTKYHRRWPLGEFLADRLLDTERAKGLLTQTDVLIPVPLHLRRHVSRGYNQADVIARRLGARCKIPVIHAVRRVRNTESQTHLSHADRIANIRGAFAPTRAAKKIRDKHVIVIDDVFTVGATMNEMARVLKQAEPASLCAMVLAIADPRRKGFEAI